MELLVWRQMIHALWKNFETDFKAILDSLRGHRSLLESHTNLVKLEEILNSRVEQQIRFKYLQEKEIQRQTAFVYQWLDTANYKADHENILKKREEFPTTCKWLLTNDKFSAWFGMELQSSPYLWLSGIPGAGNVDAR
jgi:hypothetical protein